MDKRIALARHRIQDLLLLRPTQVWSVGTNASRGVNGVKAARYEHSLPGSTIPSSRRQYISLPPPPPGPPHLSRIMRFRSALFTGWATTRARTASLSALSADMASCLLRRSACRSTSLRERDCFKP